ncbi:3'-5' exoribonuclease YhaM family protein [Mesoaciditoga lauensis]|uniref:3'-5' exoribonuclease YhaM family protein n=1 Tax=Mesoaciditoga lauensis TaxID=1495039 RepID=UPI00056A0EF0|nr:HD domain-containing protein [Mesoaciditoga lauensis]
MKFGELFSEEYLEKLGFSKDDIYGQKRVADVHENDSVDMKLKVVSKRLQESKDGKKFLLLTLSDKTGEIRAVDWFNAAENDSKIKINSIVKIQGRVSSYMDRLQINVDKARDALIVLKEGEYDPELFISTTKKDVKDMYSEFKALMDSIKTDALKDLLRIPFTDESFVEEFIKSPAAIVVHHAYRGGLLEHTLGVMKLCDAISHLYGDVDRDLLLVGAALHDVGKIKEYKMESYGIERTTEGELIGHIVLGVEMLNEWAKKVPNFPKKSLYHLNHMILSHHGELEWGSPTVPKTLEAMILHHADDLDSKIGQINSLKEKSSKSTWSDYDRYLGRKVILNWNDFDL